MLLFGVGVFTAVLLFVGVCTAGVFAAVWLMAGTVGATIPCLTGCTFGVESAAVFTWPADGGGVTSVLPRCVATACTACACCLACVRVVSSTFTRFTFLFCTTVFVGATTERLLSTLRLLTVVLLVVLLLTVVLLFTTVVLLFMVLCLMLF